MATSRADTARAAVDLTFEELYRGLRADVYRAALRKLGNPQDAEDVTQAAFADAYRAVLRGARPQSPRAWLLAISENVRRRRFRTAQRRPREELVDDADFPVAAELPDEPSRALTDALATLPSEQRRVFVLREIVGLSYAEIAAELDSTVGSVQMLLFRARRSLRDALDPPTVSVRRSSFLPPLPGWLAGLWSRVELAALTPRAAGALGAAVLTVGGASGAVPVTSAEGLLRPPAAADPGAAPAARSGVARVVAAAPAARLPKAPAVAATAVRTQPLTRPGRRPQPAATLPPATAPVVAAADEPAPPAGMPQAVPAPGLPGVVATAVEDVIETPLEDVVATPLELPEPPLSLPLPGPVTVTPPALPPLPPLPPLPETLAGAAGAAGASAPPVPVPAVPLPTLPRAP